jgi:ADP-ribose pyrophosphatase
LKEETGYIGKVSETTPVMFNGSFASRPSSLPHLPPPPLSNPHQLTSVFFWIDPGFCNTNLRMIHVTIDLSLPENQNPKPQLEENEFIEVFTIPLKDF